jgi:hypothetical protein
VQTLSSVSLRKYYSTEALEFGFKPRLPSIAETLSGPPKAAADIRQAAAALTKKGISFFLDVEFFGAVSLISKKLLVVKIYGNSNLVSCLAPMTFVTFVKEKFFFLGPTLLTLVC